MPVLAFCEILVQVYFAVHAVRTGRERQWLFIIKEQKKWINIARKEI